MACPYGQGAKFLVKGQLPMKKIEAIIQPSRFDAVKDALHNIGVEG